MHFISSLYSYPGLRFTTSAISTLTGVSSLRTPFYSVFGIALHRLSSQRPAGIILTPHFDSYPLFIVFEPVFVKT